MSEHDDASVLHGDRTLADKLQRLLDAHRRPDGKRFTLREVCQGIKDATAEDPEGQVDLSYSYLSQLLTGSRRNPSQDVLRGLVRFFPVESAYFIGDPSEVDAIEADLDLALAMRENGVRDIAVRAAKLSPEGKRALAAFIAHLEEPASGER